MIRVTFLGTAAAAPTISRAVSAIALEREGQLMLFDCGEGAQRQMMRYGTGFDVKDVFFTHLHADHFLGIIGFVRTLWMADRQEPVRLYGPKPGRETKPVVLVEDNGPIHVSKITLAALEARKHWLTVEWLPKYSPELNDIEVVWHDLKAHHLAHKTFTDAGALDREIHAAADALNRERNVDSLVKWRISA